MEARKLTFLLAIVLITLSLGSKAQSIKPADPLENKIKDNITYDLNIVVPNNSLSFCQTSDRSFIKKPDYTITAPVSIPNAYVISADTSTPMPTYQIDKKKPLIKP